MHRSLRIGTGALDSKSINALRSGPYEGKIAGLYDLEETLGRGHFAVVKLARHVFTGEKVAVKVIDKSKLDEVSKAHLFQEVRCMKLVQHPNVVRLYEVIDTATKLYLILELGDGGDLYDYIMRHDTGLSEQLAKEYFRQIVRAISYCHQLHVVHRDLKPENVVFFEKLGVVKLTDFGFSNKFCPGQKLETSCGSLAYSAPEILLGDSYDAPAVDVWSLGVILFMLVCGQAPFQEANDSETLTMIMDCKYNVPSHVSKECRDLIARMLVRNPEKRASLNEIAHHKWLAIDKEDNPPIDAIPLVSREQLSEEDHNLIVQKIVNGNIATKEDIQECLDKNEYNHITATYYLLAERKLRLKRQEETNKNKRPEHLAVPHNSPTPKRESNGTGPSPCLLTVPRTPGDLPQRSRKCSIVQEDEEEEDIANSITGREELAPPLNRRGSRSEGRLNLALQERLADSERRKLPLNNDKLTNNVIVKFSNNNKLNDEQKQQKLLLLLQKQEQPKDHEQQHQQQDRWAMGKHTSLNESPLQNNINTTTTTIITDSSTISIPVITNSSLSSQVIPKYKTMPSPTRSINTSNSLLQLNEIFEEGECDNITKSSPRHHHHHQQQQQQHQHQHQQQQQRQFVSRNRASYEQRRSKFHKARTASCSSSDASDDDSEKRKKRAHKLNNNNNNSTSAKPFQGRRDSHDDSSDSQEPGTGTSSTTSHIKTTATLENKTTTTNNNNEHNHNNRNSSGDQKNTNSCNILLGRRHKATRRRNGETRLRESQSLNRITEVQEDGAHALVITSTVVGTQFIPKYKGIGARILQGFTMNIRKTTPTTSGTTTTTTTTTTINDKTFTHHLSRKDSMMMKINNDNCCSLSLHCQQHHHHNQQHQQQVDKNNKKDLNKIVNINDKSSLKKMRLLGKYFQVHKKLCIPLPGLFSKHRLYKAQSCSSLNRDKIHLCTTNDQTTGAAATTTTTTTKGNFNSNSKILRCRQRAISVIRSSDCGDINQNNNDKTTNLLTTQRKSSTVVQLNNVCNELTGICALHLEQASKCCSFC